MSALLGEGPAQRAKHEEWHPEVCVIGLGYIGLPTATLIASASIPVLGVDINEALLDRLARGEQDQGEQELAELVHQALRKDLLRLSLQPQPAQTFIIAVQTPITQARNADLRYVRRATESIVPHLHPGVLVVLESTVPVETTRGLVCAVLARSGLEIGKELFVAYCPERAMPGHLLYELRYNARIIGGVTEACAAHAAAFYRRFVRGEVVTTRSETAEMAKLMENAFRDVNIAFANELALLAEAKGVDFWEARDLANRHPRVNVHAAGPGVGGHCIPVDPWFLVEGHESLARVISTARLVNDHMPRHVLGLIRTRVGERCHGAVALLGVTYKKDTPDTRESPSLRLAQMLRELGYQVIATDPLARDSGLGLLPLEQTLAAATIIVLMVDHDTYLQMVPEEIARGTRAREIIDTRGCLDREAWARAGFHVTTLGATRPRHEHATP